LPAYIAWVMLTRYIYCALLLMFRPGFEITYPFLAYFNQVYGSFLKTWVFFRLNRQRWTRQSGGAKGKSSSLSFRLRELSSAYMHSLAIVCLFTSVAVAGGLITLF
jgi:mannuronan synthase